LDLVRRRQVGQFGWPWKMARWESSVLQKRIQLDGFKLNPA
jgi:hypothetical protein